MSMSKNSCILLRADSSASSSSRVAAPKAEDSNIPVKPEPNPLATFSMNPELLRIPLGARVGAIS